MGRVYMSKAKILIVDDDMAASRLLGLGLEKTGVFEVKVENTATHAFTRAREFHPDVILLDVCMPGADGGDVAFQIHDDPSLRSIPIIFLTSLISGQEAASKTVQRGGYEFLSKPASIGKVIECIDRHLGRQSVAASNVSVA
jgi:CheY-like chemotaxis protein